MFSDRENLGGCFDLVQNTATVVSGLIRVWAEPAPVVLVVLVVALQKSVTTDYGGRLLYAMNGRHRVGILGCRRAA